MSFVVRVAKPIEYAEAGRITAAGYHADDLLPRTDGLIDFDYQARCLPAVRLGAAPDLDHSPKPGVHLWACRLVLSDKPWKRITVSGESPNSGPTWP